MSSYNTIALRPWLRRLRDMRAFAVVFSFGFVAGVTIHDPDLAMMLVKLLTRGLIEIG